MGFVMFHKKSSPRIKCAFNSRFYKIRKWCRRNLHFTTILDLIGGATAVFIGVLAYTPYPYLVSMLGVLYITTQAPRALLALKERRSIELSHRKAIHGFLHYMNNKLFGDQTDHRLTLFTVDPVNSDYIIPYVRFRVGGIDGIKDAEDSKSHYPKGIGYTGMAWEQPRNYHSCVFPEFEDRQSFEYYYTHELNIPRDIVEEISDYMVRVRQIFCYGFVDSRDQFLGVLSLDSCIEWECKPDEMPLLGEMLGVLGTLLESFSTTQ